MANEHKSRVDPNETSDHDSGLVCNKANPYEGQSGTEVSSEVKHLTSTDGERYLEATAQCSLGGHRLSLSSILETHAQDMGDGGVVMFHTSNMNDQPGSCICKVLVYDPSSSPTHDVVKEVCFSSEDDFNSKILDLLRAHESFRAPPNNALLVGQMLAHGHSNGGTVSHGRSDEGVATRGQSGEGVLAHGQSDKVAVAHGQSDEEIASHSSNPSLCEAILRSVYAQGVLVGSSIHEKQSLAEDVKRAFCLSAAAFREARARAIKSTWFRCAQVQAHLSDLKQDKGRLINPEQFHSFSVYKEVKSKELEQLSNIDSSLKTCPSFAAHVQLRIGSAENSSYDTHCIKKKSCYGWSEPRQVYCTVELVSGSNNLTDIEDTSPDHITKEVVYLSGRAEWKDKTPWIYVTSAQDQLCVKMWKKKIRSRISRGSNDLELVSFLRNMSGKKKVIGNSDTLLGKITLPTHLFKDQALSSGSIRGSFPLKSYTLRNSQGGKLPISLEIEIEFFCEVLLSDPAPEEKLLKPPIDDLELGYDALVQVAYGMHLEGDIELEASWKNVLCCYESYYRIRRETCDLALLKHLAKMFQTDPVYLGIVIEELQPLCKSAKDGKLRKSEYLLLSNIISLMIKPSIDAMEDFQSNSSLKQLNGALPKLIQLLSLLLCWDIDVHRVTACIKRWMKVSCVQRFNKHLIDNNNDGEITSRTFSKAISFLQKDLRLLNACCRQEPLEELGLFETCASEYYRLISQYVIGIVGCVKISSIDFEDLTREMSLLHLELEKRNINMELLDLRGLLHDHILDFITSVKSRMMEWVISSLNDEKWEPTSPQTNVLFSCSVVDLYYMINGVIENLTTRLSYFPFGKHYYFNIEESIFSIIQTYVKMIERSCIQELMGSTPDGYHQFFSSFKLESGVKPICLSKTLCVKLNNLHAVMQEQCTFEANLTKKWENYIGSSSIENSGESPLNHNRGSEVNQEDQRVGQLFKNISNTVNESLSCVTGSIVQCMQKELAKRLLKLIQRCTPEGTLVIEDLHILTTYLDDHLKVLNEWSDRPVFKSLLLDIATALLFCMEELALTSADDCGVKTTRRFDCLELILKLLYDYFHGDGIGISTAEMDCICERFREILECSRLETHDLCAFYWKAWDKFNDEAGVPPDASQTKGRRHLQVVDYLLLLQQRDDDEARIIVATQKLLAKDKTEQTSWIPKYQFEMPRDVLRGVTEYFKSIQTTPFNVSYPTFEKIARW